MIFENFTLSKINSFDICPGDDPNKVKARLKAWAHAVAFVSTTHHQRPPNSF